MPGSRAKALAGSTVLIAVAVLGAAGPSSGAPFVADTPTPTLTLQRDCRGYPPTHAVRITLSGFPPNRKVSGSVELPGGGGVNATVQTDAEGEFAIGIGSEAPGTFGATARWAAKSLAVSLDVTCGRPAERYCAARSLPSPDQIRAPERVQHPPHERRHCSAAKA